MRKLSQLAALNLLLTLGPVAASAAEPAHPAVTAAPERKKLMDHLKNHQQYPATRAELLASCQNLADFSDAEKKWFAARLPEGTYASADEVMKALARK